MQKYLAYLAVLLSCLAFASAQIRRIPSSYYEDEGEDAEQCDADCQKAKEGKDLEIEEDDVDLSAIRTVGNTGGSKPQTTHLPTIIAEARNKRDEMDEVLINLAEHYTKDVLENARYANKEIFPREIPEPRREYRDIAFAWSKGWWHPFMSQDNAEHFAYTLVPTDQGNFYPYDIKEAIDTLGVIYLRQNSLPYFDFNDIELFINDVLPTVDKPFVLITSDGDNTMPIDIASFELLLANPYLKLWYTQNLVGEEMDGISNDKLKALPIGIDLHTQWDDLWPRTPFKRYLLFQYIKEQAVQSTRKMKILMEGAVWKSEDRLDALTILQDCDLVDQKLIYDSEKNRMPKEDVLQLYGEYQFVLSFKGAGIDSHRTWESMYMGAIPIVKRENKIVAMEDNPILFIDSWEEVCDIKFLEKHAKALKDIPARFNAADYIKAEDIKAALSS